MFHLLIMLACPETKVVNVTKLEWNHDDQINLNIAKKRCKELYSDAPCLKLFIKKGFNDFYAECGDTHKRDDL